MPDTVSKKGSTTTIFYCCVASPVHISGNGERQRGGAGKRRMAEWMDDLIFLRPFQKYFNNIRPISVEYEGLCALKCILGSSRISFQRYTNLQPRCPILAALTTRTCGVSRASLSLFDIVFLIFFIETFNL